MANEWAPVPFKNLLAEPVRNGIYKPKEFHGRGAKIVNMGELFAHPRLRSVPMKKVELSDSEKRRFLLAKGDLLFARRSLVAEGAGKCSVVLEICEPTTFESSIIRARPDDARVDSLFLYYFFNSFIGLHLLGTIRRQVAVAGITGRDLSELEIPVPSLPEQRAIAHILGALDDKIELNRRMNATLEEMARALFKDWFVDFGPTRAKMEGRAPDLPPRLAALFPDRLDEQGKPEGWEEKPLDKIADFLNGLALQKFPGENEANSLPVIKIAELRNGITANSNRASRKVPSQYVVQDGDFLFSWSGSLLAKFWTGGEGALNQHLFKVTSDLYPAWFFSEWVQHHLDEFQSIAASKATTMGHIQRGHLKAAKTICPRDHIVERMGDMMAPLIEHIIRNELESRTLAALRDTLLPKLISGEIRVNDAEKLTGEAT